MRAVSIRWAGAVLDERDHLDAQRGPAPGADAGGGGTAWDLTGRPPYRSEVLSHPSANLTVETGSHPRFGVDLPAVLVHGVVRRRFTVDLVGAGRVSAVKFRPGGYRAFFGTCPAADSVQPWPGLPGLPAESLATAVLSVPTDEERATALDAALAPRAPEPDAAYLHLLDLLELLRTDRSLLRVDDVAAAAALSVRSLQRVFAGHVGLSPKEVLARYRLQDAVTSIDAGDVDDLADLAASLGWFDQAHFSRDFRAVVGVPPSTYLSRARPAASGEATG